MSASNYLEDTKRLFLYYSSLGERALGQIPDEALFQRASAESNSIAVIISHLRGNMLSRWTDFLETDGEKPWRDRDAEFRAGVGTRGEVLAQWHEGWSCLLMALDGLKPEDLERTVYIRNEAHTVLEAINRQLAHYAYHVGQIVFIAKMLTVTDWKSLSIAPGELQKFNDLKFSREKSKRHFTENH